MQLYRYISIFFHNRMSFRLQIYTATNGLHLKSALGLIGEGFVSQFSRIDSVCRARRKTHYSRFIPALFPRILVAYPRRLLNDRHHDI